ncbi:unnamed protein product, partial [Ixodes pacificus]
VFRRGNAARRAARSSLRADATETLEAAARHRTYREREPRGATGITEIRGGLVHSFRRAWRLPGFRFMSAVASRSTHSGPNVNTRAADRGEPKCTRQRSVGSFRFVRGFEDCRMPPRELANKRAAAPRHRRGFQ